MYAQVATITGVILDESREPLPDVHVTSGPFGSYSDESGFYLLQVSSDKEITVNFSHIGHESVVLEDIILNTNETFAFNPIMKTDVIQVDGVTITPTGERWYCDISTQNCPEYSRSERRSGECSKIAPRCFFK